MKLNMKLYSLLIAALATIQTIIGVDAQAVDLFDYEFRRRVVPSDTILEQLGTNTYNNFPVLLRLPIEFSKTLNTTDASDIIIVDENNNVLSYDVDTFNPDGVTLVWVKVPTFSSSTELVVYYHGATNTDNDPTSVWENYAGVWHYSPSEITTIADATGNGLTGETTGEVSVYETDEPSADLGATYTTATIKTADYDSFLDNVGKFCASGWFKLPEQSNGYATFFSKKSGLSWNHRNGWYIEMSQSKTKTNLVLDNSNTFYIPDVTANWNYFYVISDGSSIKVYFNGSTSPSLNKASYAILASGTQAHISAPKSAVREYRVRNGSTTPQEAALEYATMANVNFFTYGSAENVDATVPVIEKPTFVRNADGTYSVSVSILENSGDVGVIYETGDTAITNIIATSAGPGTYTETPTNLSSGKTYQLYSYAENANGNFAIIKGGLFYYGDISIEKLSDAEEYKLIPGVFRISRADTSYDLVVNLAISGTAVADQTYEAFSDTVVIPSGSAYVDIVVQPILDAAVDVDSTVVVSIEEGDYGIASTAGSAEMTIVNLVAPAGYNTWVAAEDGLASDPANWSYGHAPLASENILFSGYYSSSNCEWDAAATTSVASWSQIEDYSGTITFMTTYPGLGFENFSIAGDAVINSGKWTHNSNTDTETYRLAVSVGGNFELAADASINVQYKGYAKNCYPEGGANGVYGGGRDTIDAVYGNVYEPTNLGAGNQANYNTGTAGGGAVYLVVNGTATVNGIIKADASDNTGTWTVAGSGSGGSIYLKAASVSGSGTIRATSALTDHSNSTGSGGRIAIILTSATELDFPVENVLARGSDGYAASGAGTILVKTANQTYGTLYIKNVERKSTYGHMYPTHCGTTPIPEGENWTFDAIVFSTYGILRIPEGTTLTLPNGFASISGSGRTTGILYDGGTIVASDSEAAVLQNKWTFHAIKPYTFPGNVTVTNGAAIGCLRLKSVVDSIYLCEVAVEGDMLVGANGYLFADMAGLSSVTSGAQLGGNYAHGGQLGIQTNSVYGSILDPTLPGGPGYVSDSADQQLGGGAIKLTVDGALTLDGKATATGNGSDGYKGGGSGGSINITAGTLSGEGSINVAGRTPNAGLTSLATTSSIKANIFCCSGGGRVAVCLTDEGATFSEHWLSSQAINANGGSKSSASGNQTNALASAGTIYLQDGTTAANAGTIYVRNNNATYNNAKTPIPSTSRNNDENLRNASLSISEAGRVRISEDFQLEEIYVAENSTIDLSGYTLTVTSLKLAGENISSGTYTAAQLAAMGYEEIYDSSTDATGVVEVLGQAFMIIIR